MSSATRRATRSTLAEVRASRAPVISDRQVPVPVSAPRTLPMSTPRPASAGPRRRPTTRFDFTNLHPRAGLPCPRTWTRAGVGRTIPSATTLSADSDTAWPPAESTTHRTWRCAHENPGVKLAGSARADRSVPPAITSGYPPEGTLRSGADLGRVDGVHTMSDMRATSDRHFEGGPDGH